MKYLSYICFIIIKTNKFMTTTINEPKNIIEIPRIANDDMFEANRDRAYEKNLEHCPCCGRAIPNAKFFINSIYGGHAYPADDRTEYRDAWIMGVGSECQKKFPKGYVYTLPYKGE